MSLSLFFIFSIFCFSFVGLIVGLFAWIRKAPMWMWLTLGVVVAGVAYQFVSGQLILFGTPMHLCTYILMRKSDKNPRKDVEFDYLLHAVNLREQGTITQREFNVIKARVVRRND